MLNIFDLMQLIALFISLFGYLPQVRKTYKTKSVNDFNIKTYISSLVALSLMEIYVCNLVVHGVGLMMLITTSCSLLLTLSMVVMILKYRKRT